MDGLLVALVLGLVAIQTGGAILALLVVASIVDDIVTSPEELARIARDRLSPGRRRGRNARTDDVDTILGG